MTNKPREMIHHLKLLHSETQTAPIWKCSKCPYKSKLRAHLNRHVNDVHEGVRKFLCQYCGKKFKRNETLMEHKATHGELTQSFTCQFCDKAFPKSFQLQQHMITHSTERPYLCDMCGKSYKTIQATERHKRFMHSENVPKWPCPRGCERTFKYRTHLSKHLKRPCKISIRMKQLKSGVRESDVEEEVVASHITIQIVCDEQLDNNIKNVA
ncbi:zinc finger protein 141-like [Macrosteles quadrilineatus]|uniref:zinc finger protein 141-like n=1 Tax=Macrosteles quadrilineatus TaxID=74068 RepID=UPI0023E24F1D|nr:zinc finger protein 141-like [Macrosteles quadrilineatus]